jgi:hypothetical protein
MTPPRYVSTADPVPGQRITVGIEPVDRVTAALARGFGLRPTPLEIAIENPMFSDRTRARLRAENRALIAAMREDPDPVRLTLREMFQAVTGKPFQLAGGVVREAASTTTTFANVLANVLNRRLLLEYSEAGYGEQSLMQTGRADNFRSQVTVNINEAPDLDTVSENATYTDAALGADVTMSAAVTKRGNLLPISKEMIANDDVGLINRMVANFGRAARRTLAKAVLSPWITNATYGPDATAWFHASHGNLQTAAISTAEIKSAITKLVAQRRPGSTERLGFQPLAGNVWLLVGTTDWVTAFNSNQAVDSLYHMFGDHNEQVIVCPLFADTNDWGVHWDSRLIESVRVNFFQGNEEPVFEQYADPEGDTVFSADRITFRVSYIYSAALVEYRGAVKAIVP